MRICLFGAGSSKINEEYIRTGYDLGVKLANENHTLVFGGGNDGLMGAVARGMLDNQAHITAILPEWMSEFEDLFTYSDKQIITEGMDDRKKKFIENADIFLVAPGGIGTLDEFFEVLTLKKLKVHNKPIIVFNINHFYDDMIEMLENMVQASFIDSDNDKLFTVTTSIEETLKHLKK